MQSASRIAYVANVRFPTEKAHGLQIAQVASALGKLCEVTLYIPESRGNTLNADPFAYYGVERAFSIVRLRSPRLSHLGPIGHTLERLLFLFRARHEVPKDARVYTREVFGALFFPGALLELHELPSRLSFLVAPSLSRARHIVVKTKALKADVTALLGKRLIPVTVLPNAIDPKLFDTPLSKEEARAELDLPHTARIALYAGSLQEWKGVGTFLEAARLVPDVVFVCVGGSSAEHAMLAKRHPYQNVRFIPHQSHDLIPKYLVAADMLVLPNSGTQRISSHYTSPLKLLEYLASGTPVVASDLPSIREALQPEEATLVPPDNPKALASVIASMDTAAVQHNAKGARERMRACTWDAYAKTVTELL